MDDRRIFERIKIDLPLEFADPTDKNKRCEGKITDVSAIGTGFTTNEDLSVNTEIKMWIIIPDSNVPVYVSGEVVWAKTVTSANQKRIGVCFKNQEFIDLAQLLKYKEDCA